MSVVDDRANSRMPLHDRRIGVLQATIRPKARDISEVMGRIYVATVGASTGSMPAVAAFCRRAMMMAAAMSQNGSSR